MHQNPINEYFSPLRNILLGPIALLMLFESGCINLPSRIPTEPMQEYIESAELRLSTCGEIEMALPKYPSDSSRYDRNTFATVEQGKIASLLGGDYPGLFIYDLESKAVKKHEIQGLELEDIKKGIPAPFKIKAVDKPQVICSGSVMAALWRIENHYNQVAALYCDRSIHADKDPLPVWGPFRVWDTSSYKIIRDPMGHERCIYFITIGVLEPSKNQPNRLQPYRKKPFLKEVRACNLTIYRATSKGIRELEIYYDVGQNAHHFDAVLNRDDLHIVFADYERIAQERTCVRVKHLIFDVKNKLWVDDRIIFQESYDLLSTQENSDLFILPTDKSFISYFSTYSSKSVFAYDLLTGDFRRLTDESYGFAATPAFDNRDVHFFISRTTTSELEFKAGRPSATKLKPEFKAAILDSDGHRSPWLQMECSRLKFYRSAWNLVAASGSDAGTFVFFSSASPDVAYCFKGSY